MKSRAGGARRLRRDEGARDDARAGVGEHAEGVPLAAGHRHLRVGEGGAALRHLGAVHHDGGAVAHAGFFLGDELHRLLAAPASASRGARTRGSCSVTPLARSTTAGGRSS